MMTRRLTQLATACVLALPAGWGAAATIAQLDQPLFDSFGFTFGDLTATTAPGVIHLLADTDGDNANGLFGGAGSDLFSPAVPVDFDPATATLEVTLTVNPNNTATNLRVVLADLDAPGTGDEFQFFVDLTGATPGVQTTISQSLLSPGPVFQQTLFGAGPGDGVQNYGLLQIQIQTEFGSNAVLDVSVNSVAIVPEPATLGSAAIAAGLVALRRRRA